ncbi:MAG: DUF5662 family protein [Lachnospiraceae bacterium]|nr:DUF5662 family protein [Lachnospiraceae bacterium]
MKQSSSNNQITWEKAKGHLRTITEHKFLVMQGCFRIGLYWQGLTHDLSKYMPSELLEGFRYYEDGKSSPNNAERIDKGYSEAWMHHKGRNRHHFEYWLDYRQPASASGMPAAEGRSARRSVRGEKKHVPGRETASCINGTASGVPSPLQTVQMPRKYVAEMLMDRIAASKNYNKETYTHHDSLAYFEKGKGHYLMHPQTKKELHGMLRILDERGEEELIRFVRDYYLKGYPI